MTVLLVNVIGTNDKGAQTSKPELAGLAPGDSQLEESNEDPSEEPTEQPEDTPAETPEDPPADQPQPAEEEPGGSDSPGTDFGTGTLVGKWTNIMKEGGFATAEFTEDGRFTVVDRDGVPISGSYKITKGDMTEGTVICSIDDTDLTMEGDFHLNGNILTWGNMMFQRD